MAARQNANMQRLASQVGSRSVELVAKPFQLAATFGAADTTATARERPDQGIDPKSVSIFAFDVGGAAAGQELLIDIKVASDSQLIGNGGIPIEVFAPDVQNIMPLAIARVRSQTPVTFTYSRTAAPGVGTSVVVTATIFGVAFSG